jgi:hypothetical protein
VKRAKLCKFQTVPAMHVIAHGSRHADAAGRTLSLEPSSNIHSVTVQVSAIWDRVAKINSYTVADCPVWRLIRVEDRNLLLYLHCAAHRPVYAIEHDQQ